MDNRLDESGIFRRHVKSIIVILLRIAKCQSDATNKPNRQGRVKQLQVKGCITSFVRECRLGERSSDSCGYAFENWAELGKAPTTA